MPGKYWPGDKERGNFFKKSEVSVKAAVEVSIQNIAQFFFLSGFFFPRPLALYRSAGEGRGWSLFSSVPLRPALKRSEKYLQPCIWYDYLVFSIATHVFIRL